MNNNCIEDICKVLNDILLVCDILNSQKYNSMIDGIINGIKSDIDEILDKCA